MAKGPRQLAVQQSEEPAAPVARPSPFGKKPLRTFALVIGLPAFLLYVASATLVIFVLSMMASEINRLEDSRGVRSMHAALDSFLNGLGDAVAGEGTWTEAYLNTVAKPDPAWMDITWGAAARRGPGYDTVLVTDQAGTIQFGENNLGALTGNIGIHFPAARTMLRDLDRGISATGDATVESRFAADQSGTVGLAAISIHQSNSTGLSVSKQSRRVLWIARHVTPSLLQDFAARFQTPLAVLTAIVDPDSSSIDLTDADGKVTGTVAWTPDRPGDIAFAHALRIASAVFFGIGLLLVIGLGLLRRAMLRRAVPEVAIALGDTAASTDEASATVRVAAAVAAEDPTLNSPIDGITASDFEVEYQPIFDLRAETLIGVEALLRWKKPDKTPLLQETLPPVLCAALLDRAGLIAIRRAVGEIAPLIGLVLTIAVSPAQLLSSVFAEKIAGTLGATGFPARRLQLSLDTTLLPAAEIIGPPIAGLRQSGVGIALNNFALGPQSVGYLAPGMADRLRLAPGAVSGVDATAARHTLVEATIAAARAVDFAVTVPGISRREDAARLLRLGCREFQGNLLAGPMPIAALTQLVLAPARTAEVRRAG